MICELCNGTGFYGDNGPGRRGNHEYIECDCTKPERKPMSSAEYELEASMLALEAAALKAKVAELEQDRLTLFRACESARQHFLTQTCWDSGLADKLDHAIRSTMSERKEKE